MFRVAKPYNRCKTDVSGPKEIPNAIEYLPLDSFPGHLEQRQFDFIVVMDLLDQRNSFWFLQSVYALLKPGGEVILKVTRGILYSVAPICQRVASPPTLAACSTICNCTELISEIGFIGHLRFLMTLFMRHLPRV